MVKGITNDKDGNTLSENGLRYEARYEYNGQNRMAYSEVASHAEKTRIATMYEYDALGSLEVVKMTRFRLILIVLCFLWVMESIMCQGKNDDVGSPTTVSLAGIPDDELENKMMNALRGDAEDANDIGLYFLSVKSDYYSGLYWFSIAAENNYPEAYYALAAITENNRINSDLAIRSVFWLYKMASANYREQEIVAWLERKGLTIEIAKPPNDESFSIDYTYSSSEELQRYREGALKGSGKAALALALYYERYARDSVTAEYWYKIGSQNGNIECQYKYGCILSKKQDILERTRGQFWIDRSRN